MQIEDSEAALRAFTKERGIDVEAPTSAIVAASVWLSFYEQVRAMGTVEDPDAWPDTLLFEFGTIAALPGHYEAHFVINFTRQFISAEGEDDDAMSQLIWMMEYEPTEDLKALGSYTEWCDTINALGPFKKSVLGSSALSAVANYTPSKISYYFTPL